MLLSLGIKRCYGPARKRKNVHTALSFAPAFGDVTCLRSPGDPYSPEGRGVSRGAFLEPEIGSPVLEVLVYTSPVEYASFTGAAPQVPMIGLAGVGVCLGGGCELCPGVDDDDASWVAVEQLVQLLAGHSREVSLGVPHGRQDNDWIQDGGRFGWFLSRCDRGGGGLCGRVKCRLAQPDSKFPYRPHLLPDPVPVVCHSDCADRADHHHN